MQFDRKYFDEAYGVNLAVKGHLLSKGLQRGLRDFSNMTWREQLYYVTINPNWHPRDVKIYLKPAAEGPTKEVRLCSEFLAGQTLFLSNEIANGN